MSKLLTDTSGYREAGFEQATIDVAEARNEMVRQFLESPIGDHLQSMEERDSLDASGGTLLNIASIHEEITNSAPGTIVFPLGYLPIWSSIGGNIVVYSVLNETFYWVDHTAFDAHNGTMFLQGTNTEVAYDKDNAANGMLAISRDSPANFIQGLLSGIYEDQLDSLD